MPWTEIGAHILALMLFPGALACAGLGVVMEMAARTVTGPSRVARPSPGRALATIRAANLPAPAVVGAFMAILAATQMSVPLNPVSGEHRNLIVAVVGLVAGGWAARVWAGGRGPALGYLTAQACWMVAAMAPAVVEQSLRPQTLGTVVVGSFIPLKVAAGLLYLLCLPVLLEIAPGSPPALAGFRTWLWLPYCGVFVSLYLPPQDDGMVGLGTFLAATVGVAAAALLLAAGARRLESGVLARVLARSLVPFAALVILIAAVSAILR